MPIFNNPTVLLVAGVFCWALWSVAMKRVTSEFQPLQGIGAVWAVYGMGAVAIWAAESAAGVPSVFRNTPSQWMSAACAALPAMAGTALFLLALQNGAKVSTATSISSAYPAVAALMAVWMFGEPIGSREMAGMAMILAGIFLLG